jgi:ATP-binding protein involved in chromosome partitioning
VELPEVGGDPLARGLVRDLKVGEGAASLVLGLPVPGEAFRDAAVAACRTTLSALSSDLAVEIRTELDVPRRTPGAGPDLIPGVRHLVAVGSGKGGVGKSTVAVNLAVALAQTGARVGLLDADVYGPSIPTMMGIRRPPEAMGGKMIPLEAHGVRLMSLGFLMADDTQHVIWRGPMVGSAVRQMLADVEWGELDYLFVDLPPGTGDAQLTLAQSVPISGAVVVMTSQDVAVRIASKAVGMFRALKVPILGVVGNMDSFACPCCGTMTPIFTRGGSEAAAAQLEVPFLGSIPLEPATVEHGDSGVPTAAAAPDSPQGKCFHEVAKRVAVQIARQTLGEATRKDPLGGLMSRFRKS